MGVTIRSRRSIHLLAIKPQAPKTLSRDDIINCIGNVSPLSEFFKTTTYKGILINAGPSVRRYSGQGKNISDMLEDGFLELVKQKLAIKHERRSYPNVNYAYGLYLKQNALTTAEYPRSLGPVEGSARRTHESKYNLDVGIDTVDSVREPLRRNDFSVREFLENRTVSHTTVERCDLSNETLTDSSLKASQLIYSASRDTSTQTNNVPYSREINFERLPQFRDACVDTRGLNKMEPKGTSQASSYVTVEGSAQFGSSNSTSTSTFTKPSPSTTTPSLLGNYPNVVPLAGSTTTKPSLMGHSGRTTGAIPSLLNISTTTDAAVETRCVGGRDILDVYEIAKSWKPQNENERKAYEQAEQEIYLMLVVGQGVRLNYLCSEFLRVTQVSLDFAKIGVPDLKTLLVQMKDLIFFKKHHYNGEVYIFPNKSSEKFQNISHIGELVTEQRNEHNIIPDPNSSFLTDMHIQELFVDRNYQAGLHSAAYGGSNQNPHYWSRNGNYGYTSGYGNGYQWNTNNQYQQLYSYYQYQNPSYYQYDQAMYSRQNYYRGQQANQRN